MLNKFSLILFTSIALLSCERQPLCDDPNAENYGADYDYCYYNPKVHFYIDEITCEAIRTDIGQDSFSLLIHNTAQDIDGLSLGGMWISSTASFDSENYVIPNDCSSYHLLNTDIVEANQVNLLSSQPETNINGLILNIHVTLRYGSPTIGDIIETIWEGEVHFDPAESCKLIEIEYK